MRESWAITELNLYNKTKENSFTVYVLSLYNHRTHILFVSTLSLTPACELQQFLKSLERTF